MRSQSLKGRPVDGWEYEPLNKEWPADSGAKDGVFEEWPVDNPKPGARPVGVRTEAPRSEMQPVDDTASERKSRNGPVADPRIAIGPVPPITNEIEVTGCRMCQSDKYPTPRGWRRDGPDDRGRAGHRA